MNYSHLASSTSGHNNNNKLSADLPPHFRSRYTTTTTTPITTTTAPPSPTLTLSTTMHGLTATTPSPSTATTSNKFAPARRLAARQTLRLAIPKQQGDSYNLQNACNGQLSGGNATHSSILYRHSPSQLPPAPILKRSHTPATAHAFSVTKSPAPLESHLLPTATTPAAAMQQHANGSCHTATPHTTAKFLSMRKPSITLSAAADVHNNNNNSNSNNKNTNSNKLSNMKTNNTNNNNHNSNNLFAFAQDMDLSPASVEMSDHSPIFADLAASTSSNSPTTHQLTRLFNLSPPVMRYSNMSDFSDSSHSGVVSPASSLIENFHKKTGASGLISGTSTPTNAPSTSVLNNSVSNGNGLVAGVGSCGASSTLSAAGLGGRQNLINTSSSSSSSLKETSSTSQQVVNSSSTTTRVEKKSQRLHHVTSSSSSSSSSSKQTSSSEMKTAALKRDLSEIKNSMSEINDLALGRSTTTNTTTSAASIAQKPSINDLSTLNALNSSDAINKLKKKIRSSIENLVDGSDEPLVTFPDGDDENDLSGCMDLVNASSKGQQLTANGLSGSNKTIDTVKFEEKRTKTESKTKVVTDGFSSEQATSNLAESKRLQAGDIDYKEAKAASAMRNRLEIDGVKAEENAAIIQEALSLRAGDITQQASNNVAAASIKVQSDTFSADKKAISQSQQSQTMTSNGIISQEKHVSSASQSNYTMTHRGVSSSGSSMISSSSQMSATNGHLKLADLKLDDLKALSSTSGQREIEQAISKYSNVLTTFVDTLQESKAVPEKSLYLDKINEVIRRAWAVPTHGHELGYSLCNSLRVSGGLDLLMKNCVQTDMAIQFSSAQLLEQCLTTENRTHVVDNGLDKVVNVACVCTKNTNNTKTDTKYSRVGTGILEHLFKHSEGTCSDVIKLGGLDAVLFECRQSDVETLRHCASALANLSLYGGAENQEAMINRKIPLWLFPLAFHDDDNIKYYACLAIAVLVANKEIEAEVLKSGTLDLVEPFVTSHDPSQFAKSNLAHAHGQSKHWLQRLVPVLSSNREEARNLAAFHFCMEAGIKREQGNTEIFREIGAIEALKTVASCPNAIASKFAAQALRLIGETVPHKLSQQVPLWSVEDVQEWVKQIGFAQFESQFQESQVDGDLLLKLNEGNLRDDIGISNGILLKRFERELQNLKKMADYSSKDSAKMHQFLAEIGPEYCTYTYSMLHAGIDRMSLPQIKEEMLIEECGIKNSIHRLRILNAVKCLEIALPSSSEENMTKTLDVFVSYRRSNGSQLASLLKVHLQLRGFTVFIDVERLEAGKFDNGLLNSIRQAKNFILVLTPNALERCVDDEEGKDWVHREVVTALNSNCNIIPIIDQQFYWPETERLPEDMRSVCHFNGVTWIHDYQDACIDKLERFMRGEKNLDRLISSIAPSTPGSASVTYQRMHSNDSDYQSSVGGVGGGSSGVGSGGSSAGSACGNGSTSGGGQAANHQANRYRQSSSPARQRIGSGAGSSLGGSGVLASVHGSQLAGFARGSKRNLLAPYRTQPLHHKGALPMGGSMQNVSPLSYRPPRRSSAVGISHDSLKPNPSNFRSHSVDGLLEGSDGRDNQRIAEAAALVAAGSMALTNASSANSANDSTHTLRAKTDDNYNSSIGSVADASDVVDGIMRRDKTNLPPNPQHRKSRSLDHFLDEQSLQEIVASAEPADGTQSMHNLAAPSALTLNRGALMTPMSQRILSQREQDTSTPERLGMRNNAVTRQSPEGLSSAEDDHEDTQSRSSAASSSKDQARGHSNRGSANSNQHHHQPHNHNTPSSSSLGSNNKTLFNRTLKKVRSFIKNNEFDDPEIPGLILSKVTTPSSGKMLFW